MAKDKLKDKIKIKGEFTFLPGYFLEDMDGQNLEDFISEKLSDAGYDVGQSFDYKIVIEHKK
jgi:hypothetical protein